MESKSKSAVKLDFISNWSLKEKMHITDGD